MLKAIIFDAYGTLFSTGTGSVDAAARILRKAGRDDIDARNFYARWKQLHRKHTSMPGEFAIEDEIFRRDLHRLYEEYRIDSDADADVKIMLDTLGKRSAFPETRDVLAVLGRDFTVCIGSTTDTGYLMRDVERSGISIDHVFTSESLREYKPFPGFYRMILDALGIEASEALFVGDSLTDDVDGPQRVGMKACWINRKHDSPGDIRPDYELYDLRGVVKIAEELRRC